MYSYMTHFRLILDLWYLLRAPRKFRLFVNREDKRKVHRHLLSVVCLLIVKLMRTAVLIRDLCNFMSFSMRDGWKFYNLTRKFRRNYPSKFRSKNRFKFFCRYWLRYCRSYFLGFASLFAFQIYTTLWNKFFRDNRDHFANRLFVGSFLGKKLSFLGKKWFRNLLEKRIRSRMYYPLSYQDLKSKRRLNYLRRQRIYLRWKAQYIWHFKTSFKSFYVKFFKCGKNFKFHNYVNVEYDFIVHKWFRCIILYICIYFQYSFWIFVNL